MDLNEDLRSRSLSQGIDYFGVADLSSARDAVLAQGGQHLAAFPRSIAVGIALPNPVVDQLPRRNERSVRASYQHHAYDIVNLRLDMSASLISSHLQQLGYSAYPVPASKRVNDERLWAEASHKLSAHLAGLGWIGKSCLLVTPGNGPRVRWATVFTDAPMRATGDGMEEQCGECRECVDVCPVGAFTGRSFRPEEPREARYDAHKCDKYFQTIARRNEMAVCGLCLYVCPRGRGHGSGPSVV